MSWRAMQRNQKNRAGGLTGRDRGWLPGTSQSNTIGIPSHLVNKVRDKTNTLVTKENAQNIAGGTLTKPIDYPNCKLNQTMLIDTRCLVVEQNQLSGVGRFRSQFNVDADGITQARYYLSITPNKFQSNSCNNCKKPNPGCSICIDTISLQSLNSSNSSKRITSDRILAIFALLAGADEDKVIDNEEIMSLTNIVSGLGFNSKVNIRNYIQNNKMDKSQFTNYIINFTSTEVENLFTNVNDYILANKDNIINDEQDADAPAAGEGGVTKVAPDT